MNASAAKANATGTCKWSGIRNRRSITITAHAAASPSALPAALALRAPRRKWPVVLMPLPTSVTPWPARMASKTSTASSAPMGSMTMPSHLRTLPLVPVGRTKRSSGPITVGPVTLRMAPSSRAMLQFSPRM